MTRSGKSGPIVVINPNSNQAVTDGLAEALAPFQRPDGPPIECLTLAEGPFGIESQSDSDLVVAPLIDLVKSRPEASAFIIACYSDPGLDACRTMTDAPCFGIQESGVLAALARGDMFGVIAISEGSIARHRRYVRRMGVLERLAGERALNMSVAETATGEDTFAALERTGNALINDGADVIIFGCAGMATHRATLEARIGVPVVEPTQAAVAMALGAVLPS